uniref:PDZ domain-containing protein n=1 Tax=Prymnesium polylepis TaxID=72548 RepID=A0A6T7X8X1_9EUKA|mmetsp:Transcript_14512/g.36855  ORF Transcript_14512/g.36855 Transcript_14512/m.36855 type:complete len:137 (+) Transcript_14512:91-501(+)
MPILQKRSSENLLPSNVVDDAPELKRSRSKRGSKVSVVSVVDAVEVVLTRDEPNVRAGIVFDNEYSDRAIVQAVLDGSPAAETRGSPPAALWIRPRDEIFAIDGVRVTSAKHCVQMIRQSNKLSITVLKSRKPISA